VECNKHIIFSFYRKQYYIIHYLDFFLEKVKESYMQSSVNPHLAIAAFTIAIAVGIFIYWSSYRK